MFVAAVSYLVSVVSSFLLMAFIVRFLMQFARIGGMHALSQTIHQAVSKITDPFVQGAEKLLPNTGHTILVPGLMLVLELLKLTVLYVLNVGSVPSVLALVGMALSEVMGLLLNVAFYAIVIDAILSWVPVLQHPALVGMLGLVTRPLLTPIRQQLARYNLGMDFSPLLAIVVIQLVEIVVLQPFSAMVFCFMAT